MIQFTEKFGETLNFSTNAGDSSHPDIASTG
jgi:hypothetical protein